MHDNGVIITEVFYPGGGAIRVHEVRWTGHVHYTARFCTECQSFDTLAEALAYCFD